ncbi:hypothetical protein ACFL2J_04645 [Candidatus Omnitrophota bacterium]
MVKKAKAHRKGRICKFADCKTILSIYNPGHCCSIHLEEDVRNARRVTQ